MLPEQREWPEVVGYQHEVLHTGVLRYLLDSEHGGRVATQLLGISVSKVWDVRIEQRLDGFSGKPDLIAKLSVHGEVVDLAVETKVDSDVRPEQLKREAEAPARGLLLSVGLTALNFTARDLSDHNDRGLSNWKATGPLDWADVLSDVTKMDDPVLAPYLRACRNEADSHRRAQNTVLHRGLSASRVESNGPRSALLEHFAWLHKIREGNSRGWRAGKELSGAGMLYWSEVLGAWREIWGRDVFLQFDCNDQRRLLRLKVGGPKGEADILAALDAARDLALLAGAKWQINTRAPRAQTDTHTAAYVDFSELGAEPAAELTHDLVVQIEKRIGALR